MFYEVRLAHIILAGGSIVLFGLRGGFSVLAVRPLPQRIWKVLPHIVDSLLLAMGIWLAVMLRLNPFHVTWLGVKILCVIGYIVLGVLAFRLQRPRWLRFALFAGAILLFAFIVSIAIFQDARGIFVLMA
ncbi:MAG: SirB2 family protein [Gammaproteobacteria bacterium]|nr:SirB2 family protein [Gammaproteobacteria bacterium]MDE2024308.1 SirB2 family protein [Gammaproteobacteria bacterium]